MQKITQRSEVSSNDKWNIELIYKDKEEFDKDFNKVTQELLKLEKLCPDFSKDALKFKNFFMQDEKVSRLLSKLSIYTNCKSDEDKTNSLYQELVGKVNNLCTEYEEKTSNIIPQIIKMDSDKVYSYISEYQELEPYKYLFKRIMARKKHTLSEEVEKALASYQPVFDASSDTYSYLTNADLQLGTITNEDNEEVELSESNYSIYIKSNNREVRKAAFKKLYNAYKGINNSLTSTYSTTVNTDSITARLRNYDSSIAMYLKPNDIPVVLYNNLIKTVRANLSSLYDYYALKKDILKLDEYHLYDTYVPVLENVDKDYTFEEAKDIVIKALSVYGEDYINVLKTAFADGWIDKYPNKGKRSGAYSTGSYDTLPYVLLNYTNKYDDVSTLCHELGHSMHSYYTNKNNPYITADYPIFLAEIASTTNELLLSHYMYENSTKKEEKLSILNQKLDLFKATIFRQTMFAEFEQIVHEYVDNKNILTADYLNETYYKLNQEYFGEGVVVDDDIKYEWSRVPHFYTPFYVYQYATSLSIACYVAKNIINNTPGFKENYIKFLSSGGRDYPLEVLKIIDIDLNDTKVFESAIDEFKTTLDQFKKMYYEK